MITLQIITIVILSTVYTVDTTLTVMAPFSTESGSDPPVSITMPIKTQCSQENLFILLLIYVRMYVCVYISSPQLYQIDDLPLLL